MDNPKEQFTNVFDYILEEETNFRTRKIPLASNWEWSMYDHIDKSFQLKNSQFTLGDNSKFSRPFKNIILPIANVNYRSEGFDVKDIEIYVDNAENYHMSLLTRKFHNKWAIKFSIDTAIDDSVESYFDYGLSLVKDVNEERPLVIDLKSDIAFCNQSDVLSGAICLKWTYGIDELMDMEGKWNKENVQKAILNASFQTKDSQDREIKSPSKSVEIYELHGVFPESWLGADKLGEDWQDTGKYVRQMHIVTYYTDSTTDSKNGLSLYKGKSKMVFKALKRDKVSKRACGRGGIEELFHPQIWTNYSEIHLQGMLEATSKVVTKTTDKKLYEANKSTNIKNGQVFYVEEGKTWEQMVIQPFNKTAFDNYVNVWEQNARTIGSASDPQLGLNPTSGTPLGTTEIVTQQGEGIHEYRRGKIAVFWGEIYRDWVLKYLSDEMAKGDNWLDELTVEELQEVADRVVTKEVNERIKEKILSGSIVTPEERDVLAQTIKESFLKGGKKRFLKIMKDEIKDIPLDVRFNIAGKQKNLYDVVNKLNAIFRTVFANPAVLQSPGMSELFNNILESSGFSPIDFTSLSQPSPQQGQPQGQPSQIQSQVPALSNSQ